MSAITVTVPASADSEGERGSALLTTEELALMLRVDPSTIRRWRASSPPMGPPYIHHSGRVTKYLLTDVQRWLTDRRIVPEAA